MARLFRGRRSAIIPWKVKKPWMCGLISDHELCVTDLDTNTTYVININTRFTLEVNNGDSNVYFTSCVPIGNDQIVCGKGRRGCTGDSLDGCITIYNRQWGVIRDINIPRNNLSRARGVYVDVDNDGMILATHAAKDESNIYVINPADGKINDTLTILGKTTFGKIQALSSGDIVVDTINGVVVISRSGEERCVIIRNRVSGFSVDKRRDILYITYWDTERGVNTVDQFSCDGTIRGSRIVDYVTSEVARSSDGKQFATCISRCLVTPLGYLAGCDGNELHVHS